MLSLETVRSLLSYDKESGEFTWMSREIGNGNFVGKSAGYRLPRGYITIAINGRRYMAHRVAWLWVYGEWPVDALDHIDHDKSNNRIANLRAVTTQENQRNQSRNSNNTSGFTGVSFDITHKRWVAKIRIDGRLKSLGRYATKEEAIQARIAANKTFGFHDNHGMPREAVHA